MGVVNFDLSNLPSFHLASLTEVETGKTLSSDDFKAAIKARANYFSHELNLGSGNAVVLLNNNSIQFFIDFLALCFTGITAIPLDGKMHPQEIERLSRFIQPNIIITEEKVELLSKEQQASLVGVALVLFTSGTTSAPKGVMISQEALKIKLQLLSDKIPSKEIANTLCFLPTFFGHGLICNSLFPIFFAKNFYISKTMSLDFASSFNDVLNKYQINFFSSVPSHWEMILELTKKYSGTSLIRVHCASAPLREEKIKAIKEWLGAVELYDLYGATEMLGWFAIHKLESSAEAGVFTDFWDADVKYTSEGELLVKANYMFSGYWQKNEGLVGSYFSTGDIFRNHKLIGRNKNIINKNGIKIQSEEIDEIILSSQLVSNSATFPIENRFTGETIACFVVLKTSVTIDQLKNFCREQMSPIKIPSEFIVVDKIPVNARGKVSHTELQAAFQKIKNKK